MSYEVKINDRIARVQLLNRRGKDVVIEVDGKEYILDFIQVAPGKYSILHDNRSYNLELIPGDGIRQYVVNSFKSSYEVNIIDAEAKYLASRLKGQEDESESTITAPIPGKVVKILATEGEKLEAGQTILIISAMKMESEYKAARSGTLTELRVSEGQNVEARQVMAVISYDEAQQE